MTKKRKVIKRVYEGGNETTTLPVKEKDFVKSIAKALSRADKGRPAPTKARAKKEYKRTAPKPKPAVIPTINKDILADRYELPSHYGITRLTLLLKDPHWIYAYWEIAPESIRALEDLSLIHISEPTRPY
mgnify:CR=1 FL=1